MFLLDFLGHLFHLCFRCPFLFRPTHLPVFWFCSNSESILNSSCSAPTHPQPHATHTTFKFKSRMFNLQNIFQNHSHFSIIVLTAEAMFLSLAASLSCKLDLE